MSEAITATNAVADLMARLEVMLAAEGDHTHQWPAIETAMARVLTAEVKDFTDVRALAWFANRQMSIAFAPVDPVHIRNAVDRARFAMMRLATELDAIDPPRPEMSA